MVKLLLIGLMILPWSHHPKRDYQIEYRITWTFDSRHDIVYEWFTWPDGEYPPQ